MTFQTIKTILTDNMKISVVIPALNEGQAIGEVVRAVPADRVHEIIVVDNGSTDDTATQASSAGARVIFEPRPGYGFACLAGAKAAADADVIVFLDGDRSDDPASVGGGCRPCFRQPGGSGDRQPHQRTAGERRHAAAWSSGKSLYRVFAAAALRRKYNRYRIVSCDQSANVCSIWTCSK